MAGPGEEYLVTLEGPGAEGPVSGIHGAGPRSSDHRTWALGPRDQAYQGTSALGQGTRDQGSRPLAQRLESAQGAHGVPWVSLSSRRGLMGSMGPHGRHGAHGGMPDIGGMLGI